MRGDRALARHEVSIDAPVLHVLLLIPSPRRLFGTTERRMHHRDDEPPAGLERAGDAVEHRLDRMDVLIASTHAAASKWILRQESQLARIADVKRDVRIAALPRRGDQLAGRVDACDIRPALVHQPAQHPARTRRQTTCSPSWTLSRRITARQDDMLLIFASLLADELVIPLCDVAPVGARAVFLRRL
jgi:hypothetical protein